MFQKFLKCIKGNVALAGGILAPVLFGAVGLAVDYSVIYKRSAELQEAADAAALAAVKELSIIGVEEQQIEEVVAAFAKAQMQDTSESTTLSIQTKTDRSVNEVKVNLEYHWKPFVAHLIDSDALPLKANSTARLAGEGLTCVIGLMQPHRWARSSIHLDQNAVLDAEGCSVYSNSTAEGSLRADRNSKLRAHSICSAGGILFRERVRMFPRPIPDCPKMEDPLANRMPPTVGACDHQDLVVSASTKLEPGVYCGGLRIEDDAEVKLESGEYIIKDGPLVVTDEAALIGEGVGFFLTGYHSIFDFHSDTTISLTAAKSGKLAGLLFFEDPNVPYSFRFRPRHLIALDFGELPSNLRLHRISSNNARTLLGTIYAPKSILLINANAPVADTSSYTAIIVGRLWLKEGPILTLNARYTETRVPVPGGLINARPVIVK